MMIRRHDEDGIALVTVLLVTMVLLLAVAGSMAYAIGSQPLSKHDQDWNSALAAAEGGIDDYIFRLNENDQYYLYSGTNLPPDGNQAFTTWVSVPNSATGASMRYTVDTTNLTAQGAILLTATGRSGSVTRSVQATIRRRSFIDYVYFTDYETFDPASYPTSGSTYTAVQAQANCARHFYDVPTRGSQCLDLNFVTGDTINGALHSNDAILVCGHPIFTGNVTTSYNVSPRYRSNSGCSPNTPSFKPADPKFAAALTMPPNDIAVKAQTDPTLAGTGCLFTGPTSITLNSSGTMNVTSPFTKSSNCTLGTNVALPPNGVIYIQNVPSATTDPNYTAGCLTQTQIVPSGVGAVVQHPLGYPQLGDITTYGCRNGDVFLQGTLKGRLTIAADNNIEVVGNIMYAGGIGGNDILGLVANNYVEIYHPVGYVTNGPAPPAGYCNGGTISGSPAKITNNNTYCNLDDLPGGLTTSFNNPTIQAALLVVAHSFRVQNYNYGDASWTGGTLGTITINGAIAQKYRGVVGQTGSTSSGFLKNYNYDQRLSYQSPPHFLSPVAAAWRIATWIEQKAAFAWNAP